MSWKLRSPIVTSAIGGATAAAFTMLGAEKRLMQFSLTAFLYYLVQIPARLNHVLSRRLALERMLFVVAAPLLYFDLDRIVIVVEMYRVIVHNSALMFCIGEAIAVMFLCKRVSVKLDQFVYASEIDDDVNWIKHGIVVAVVAGYAFCAWLWVSPLWAGLPTLSNGLVQYIALINIPIVTAISVIDERGSIVDGVVASFLISYCMWASSSTVGLNISAVFLDSDQMAWRSIILILLGVFAILTAVIIYLDSDTASSDTDTYLLEIEPFIKACLVLLGTNLLCTMIGYHSNQWYRFRFAEACIIPVTVSQMRARSTSHHLISDYMRLQTACGHLSAIASIYRRDDEAEHVIELQGQLGGPAEAGCRLFESIQTKFMLDIRESNLFVKRSW